MEADYEILDSDIGLWEIHTLKTHAADGTMIAELRHDKYPLGWDGGPIKGRLQADSPRQFVQMWFNHVKGRLNAWEASQTAKANERAAALAASSERQDEPSGVSGARDTPAPQVVPRSEGSLEEILESKVASLSGSLVGIEEACARAARDLVELRRVRMEVGFELARAERALLVAKGEGRVRVRKAPVPVKQVPAKAKVPKVRTPRAKKQVDGLVN